jgi:hypothetical protein
MWWLNSFSDQDTHIPPRTERPRVVGEKPKRFLSYERLDRAVAGGQFFDLAAREWSSAFADAFVES